LNFRTRDEKELTERLDSVLLCNYRRRQMDNNHLEEGASSGEEPVATERAEGQSDASKGRKREKDGCLLSHDHPEQRFSI